MPRVAKFAQSTNSSDLRGTVTDVKDPAHLGRVKVSFPHITDGCHSGWARLATPGAGQQRGTYFMPEVDDEVLVAFQHGDLRFPYVVGSLWSSKATPPELDPQQNQRELRSKSGHRVTFDDSIGKQSVTLKSQGGQKLLLDDSKGSTKVSLGDANDRFSIVIDITGGKISITAPSGEISLDANKVSIHGTTVTIKADASLEVESKVAASVKGQAVKIN